MVLRESVHACFTPGVGPVLVSSDRSGCKRPGKDSSRYWVWRARLATSARRRRRRRAHGIPAAGGRVPPNRTWVIGADSGVLRAHGERVRHVPRTGGTSPRRLCTVELVSAGRSLRRRGQSATPPGGVPREYPISRAAPPGQENHKTAVTATRLIAAATVVVSRRSDVLIRRVWGEQSQSVSRSAMIASCGEVGPRGRWRDGDCHVTVRPSAIAVADGDNRTATIATASIPPARLPRSFRGDRRRRRHRTAASGDRASARPE